MKKRILSLLLALVLLLGMLPTVALAATTVTVAVDCSDYPKDMTVRETDSKFDENGDQTDFNQTFTVKANGSLTREYDAEDTIEIFVTPSTEKPVTQWELNGTVYSIPEGSTRFEKKLDDIVTISIQPTFFRIFIDWPRASYHWTIKPHFETSEFTPDVKSSNTTQGTVTTIEKAINEYTLQADPLPGYSFDYWIEGTGADEKQVKDNPYEVTLTADETYTAYFREWKQATASSDPKELTRADGTDVVTAVRKEDDTWTLTAYGAVLDDKNYAFTYWSCDEDSSFKSDKFMFDVTLTEDRHYVAHYLPCLLYTSPSPRDHG